VVDHVARWRGREGVGVGPFCGVCILPCNVHTYHHWNYCDWEADICSASGLSAVFGSLICISESLLVRTRIKTMSSARLMQPVLVYTAALRSFLIHTPICRSYIWWECRPVHLSCRWSVSWKHFMKQKYVHTDIHTIITGNVLSIGGLFGAGIFPVTATSVTAFPSHV